MGLLTDILSRVDAMKRRGKGLLDNPSDTLNQMMAPDPTDPNLGAVGSVMPGVSQQAIGGLLRANSGMATDVAMNSPMGLLGKIVYHGSPHTFDKFDMSKIGTGEGAQAYGHGLYFADNPAVAKSYQNDLAIKDPIERMVANMYQNRLAAKLSPQDAMRQTVSWAATNPQIGPVKAAQAAESIKNAGATYRVDIPDEHIAKMLDWDKPLSEQPQGVRDAVQKSFEAVGIPNAANMKPDGQSVHAWLAGNLSRGQQGVGNTELQRRASELLRSNGVPGIRYLDQGSRAGGQGTSNYVLFDDALAKIVGRE